MNAILEQVNSAGLWFVEFALPMLVQSGVLILILLLTDFALRKKVRAVFRYGIWLLVLLKLVLPTSLSAPLSLGYFFGDQLAYVDRIETTTETAQTAPAIVSPMIDPPRIEAGSDTSAIATTTPTIEPAVIEPVNPPVAPLSWQGAVFLAWLTVVLTMVLLLLQRAIFVRDLVAQSKEANSMMADTLESCRERMGVKRKIGLKVSANATSPAVCGLFRPVILLPQNLMSSLNPSQLRVVLLHELAHIRRGDLWMNLAQTILQIIYFYNLLLWLANCIIRRVREQAVDEMVLVAMGEKAQQYPQTLVNVAKLAFKRPALSLRLIGVVESKSALTGRIKHILNRPMPKKAKLGILGLAVVIIIAAILLPMATCTPGTPELIIKGTVKDAQTGEPIAGARVFDDGYGPKPIWEQIKADERSEWGAITNTAGEYSFLTWPEHHSIKVEAPGYKAERQSLYDGHFIFNKKDEETFDFALEPEKASDSSEFKTKLPNGVTVELVGICEHPSEGKQWWKPNGTELSKEIRVRTRGGISASGIPYNVAVKVTMPEDATFKWGRIKGAIGGISLEALDSEGRPISNMRAFRVYIDEQLTATSIQLGVATGPWKTRARKRSKGSLSTAGIVFSKAYESDGGVRIIVADEHLDLDYRIAAIDTQGKEHLFHQRGGSAGKVRQTTALFHDIKLNQIEYFLFQTRPYEWVEFRNVSLRPGVKTDVQIEIEEEPSESKMSKEMVGTWFFDNPGGDDEQMAIFPDGRVVVLYSNGHRDQTNYVNGFIELAEHDGAKYEMVVEEKGTLVQYFDSGGSVLIGKRWKRIDPQPHTNLLRPLTGPDSSKTDMQVKGKPDKTPGKLAANRAFFTPPIARIINSAVERKDCFIDFDNDKLYSHPSDFHSRAREQQETWKRENSIDASATVSEGAEGLWGEEMVIIPLANVEFDRMTPVSFRDVLQQATPGTPAVMTAIGQLPKTYVFKTREGGMGLLQILEVQRKRSPHYIKIRYKMVPRTFEADVKITSNKNLQDLGKAMVMFARDHQRKLPDSLQDFAPYLRNKRDIKWLSQKVKYLGKGKTENDRPDTVIAYDSSLLLSQQGTNVLFLDAHVEYVQADRLEKLGISETAILIETRLLSVSEDFLKDIGLDANSIHDANAWSKLTPGVLAASDDPNILGLILDDLNVSFLLRATQAHEGAKMLAAPRVTVLEGKEARIANQRAIHYISGYAEPNRPSDEPEPKHDSLIKGLELQLTPNLTPDNKNIILDVDFEFSEVIGFEERMYKEKYPYSIPQTEVVSIKTRRLVPDGKTLLIGGLKITAEVKSQAGVPILSKLPLIGKAFRSRSTIKDHKILLILLKTGILSPEQAEEMGLHKPGSEQLKAPALGGYGGYGYGAPPGPAGVSVYGRY